MVSIMTIYTKTLPPLSIQFPSTNGTPYLCSRSPTSQIQEISVSLTFSPVPSLCSDTAQILLPTSHPDRFNHKLEIPRDKNTCIYNTELLV
jgi:hypothetical protein